MSSVTPTKKSLKVEIVDEITEKLMEKLQDVVNQKYKIYSRNIKTPQIKNLRRHRSN
jgi:hypothetical protein